MCITKLGVGRTPQEVDNFLERCEYEFNDKFISLSYRHELTPIGVIGVKEKIIIGTPDDIRMWMLEKLQDAIFGVETANSNLQ